MGNVNCAFARNTYTQIMENSFIIETLLSGRLNLQFSKSFGASKLFILTTCKYYLYQKNYKVLIIIFNKNMYKICMEKV